MTYEFHDFSNVDSVNQLKKDARGILREEIMEFLRTRYEDVMRVGENEFGVVVGSAPDEDGFASDVVVCVKCITKPWYTNENCRSRPVIKYDLAEEAELYEFEVKAKDCPKK